MSILFVFIFMICLGILLIYLDESDIGGIKELVGGVLVITGSVVLSASLILIPVNRMDVYSNIEEFKSVQETASTMRENRESWEAAAFQQKIADRNAWLASTQYYNGTVLDIWIPDEIEDMESIE